MTLIWLIVVATAATVVAAAAATDFSLVPGSFTVPAAVAAVAAIGGTFYRVRRPDARLSAVCTGTAQILAFTAAAAPLSYLAASAGLPLWDAEFAAADRALGLDWMAMFAFMDARPELHRVLAVAYVSLMPQAALVVILLGLTGRLRQLDVFLVAFALAALATIGLSGLFPAEGTWAHEGAAAFAGRSIEPITQDMHLAHVAGLRDGSFRLLMASGAMGIVTFPSLHAASAVLLMRAWWSVPYLRWPGLAINAAMLAATPVDGSHYLVDVIAGVAIAVLALGAAWRLAGLPDPARIPAAAMA